MPPSWLEEERSIDAPVAGLGLVELSGDLAPEGLPRAASAGQFGALVIGAGGDPVIPDVGHRSAPDWLCWYCWHHRAKRNNALIPNIGRLISLREGESLHVVCVVRFNLPSNTI